jgi:hypothetical protein
MLVVRTRIGQIALMMTVAAIAFLAVGPAAAQDGAEGADLAAIKAYSQGQAAEQKAATEELRALAEAFFAQAEEAGFDYQALWDADPEGVAAMIAAAKEHWLAASTAYERNEGLVAGVPSLSYYDVWLDAGPSGEEDPENALDWTLELPNGESLEKPGNFFHNLTEPLIWGTDDAFVGLQVDLNENGEMELGEVIPEANLFIATAQGLDDATAEMQQAIDDWEPSLEDVFSALLTMVPTMNEYFEQWKSSAFVQGETSTEKSFVATSRLFDVNGIVGGLDLAYDEISPVVIEVDPALNDQIEAGFDDLVTLVGDLYDQEAGGKQFSPDEADLHGTEAQQRADRLAGLIAQAVTLLGIQI